MSKCPHTHFPKGAHVFVILRSGEKFEDKFLLNEGRGEVKLEKRGWIPVARIRSMSYRRLKCDVG